MRTRWLSLMVSALLSTLIAYSVRAQEISLDVREHTLKNGMTLLTVPRRGHFTFSAYVRFKAGSVQEQAGKTGLSHMLEHMMFKGTRSIGTLDAEEEELILQRLDRLHRELSGLREAERSPFPPPALSPVEGKDRTRRIALQKEIAEATAAEKALIVPNEFWEIYRRHGAVGLNASASRDGTQYFVSLPSNRLELWAIVESDRIRHPVFREFYTEREVVKEERRQRYEANPDGALSEALIAMAFTAHPYRNPIIGWPSDLDRLFRPDAIRHFRSFYAPNNAIVVLVGDLDPERTVQIIEEQFGSIPPQPLPELHITQEPPQRGERRVSVRFDAQPRLMVGYHIPAMGHPDTYALQVAAALMGTGRTSRFYRGLIDGKRLASSIEVSVSPLRDPGLLTISATPLGPHTPEELEKEIGVEIERLKEAAMTDRELERIRNQLEADLVRSLRSNASLAAGLGNAQAMAGDWRYLLESRKRLKAVTAKDVQQAVISYLTTANRTVATLLPAKP
ncbi:MAG: insulinase family protein [Candidatus Methylomirabilis oxyfera]|nr:insulinase family protein [Candidatus Methylomirabilis oxyfera]